MGDVPKEPAPKRPRTTRAKKPAPLMPWQGTPDLVALRARDQVGALLMATHPRCCNRDGAATAAAAVLTGHVARHLWDEWVMGTVRWFAVETRVTKESGRLIKQSCLFGLGMSMLTMGVTHELVVRESPEYGYRLDFSRGLQRLSSSELHLVDFVRGTETFLLPTSDIEGVFCGNCKWFVGCCYCGGRSTRSIAMGSISAHQGGSAAVDIFQFPPDRAPCFVCFNKLVENEAFLMFPNADGVSLWIIDVAQSCSTKCLTMSSIRCKARSAPVVFEILAMRKQDTKAIFLSYSSFSQSIADTVYALKENGDQEATFTIVAANAEGLYQLSESLFCVLQRRRAFIFDCNNLETAISCIQVGMLGSLMVGLGCFLKLSEDRISVIDASSSPRKEVASIEFLLPGCSFRSFLHRTSRIW
ncbi:hypothetical protein Pelo_8452 [Pelomyxa schiedti]|nr:hypothetical protein Pelo_8452 [Pelomyxa schiedti]